MKIGIFGGSFNPPHKMHKNIALELINKKYLDKVIYVPVGNKYKKKDLVSHKNRLEMLKLMISNNEEIFISDIADNNNLQYTYQQLDFFKNIYKDDDIYFICGSDNLNEFDTWMNYKYILENYKILVIKRNNDNIEEILKKYKEFRNSIVIANVESEKISSSMIRKIIKNKEIVLKYIETTVYDYIEKNNLYGGNNEKSNKKI